MHVAFFSLLVLLLVSSPAHAGGMDPTQALYVKHCGECHNPDRLGAMGPALLPENLKRLRKKKAAKVIAKGRPATQMLPFEEVLTPKEIQTLVDYIYTPLDEIPTWDWQEMEKSRVVHVENHTLPDKPLHKADPMNMFLVVELADHHVTVLDGDTMEPLHRFQSRFALHGGPKYDPEGRFVYFGSRDGWISRFDMHSFEVTSEIRAGINTRNVAVSADGKTLMVANYLPHNLVVLDATTMRPLQVIPATDDKGETSRVSAVYSADPRGSFIAAMKDIPEVWEIPFARQSDAPVRTDFKVRRIKLGDNLNDFFFTQDYKRLIGASRKGVSGQVVDLDAGKKIAEIDIPGMPHLSSGITWAWNGRTVMATPNIKESAITVIDLSTWEVIKQIPTLGPGFFMRSHKNSPYAWTDVFFGKDRDAVHIIDKATLEIVKTVRPMPGKTSAHVEFDKAGKRALLSIWDPEGAVIVYDGDTLEEIKRLPMKKPSGKYNVHNKITREEGTSH